MEFVICLPVLVFVVTVMLAMGGLMGGQARVVAKARYDAWAKRSMPDGLETFDFRQQTQGEIRARAEEQTWTTPALAGFPPKAKSSHVVFGGSWDYRTTNFDRQANFDLTEKLVRLSGQLAAQKAGETIAEIKNLAHKLQGGIAQALRSMFLGNLNEMEGKKGDLERSVAEQQETVRKKLEEFKTQARQKVDQLTTEINELNEKIKKKQKELQELLAKGGMNIEARLREIARLQKELGDLGSERKQKVMMRSGWEQALNQDF